MRVSPVAWLFDDLSQVLEEAEKTALPTHNHPEGIKGAKAVAHAIWHFRKSRFSEESKDSENEETKGLKNENAKASKDENETIQGFMSIARSYYEDFDTRVYPKGKFDETCMDAVPLSFYLLSQASSFEDAIRLAISHGGDSDTIGAIVGSIAEARFGIPQEMKEKALSYLPKDMTRIYQQFKANNEIKKIDKKYKKLLFVSETFFPTFIAKTH